LSAKVVTLKQCCPAQDRQPFSAKDMLSGAVYPAVCAARICFRCEARHFLRSSEESNSLPILNTTIGFTITWSNFGREKKKII
jgi:hypothetical protein